MNLIVNVVLELRLRRRRAIPPLPLSVLDVVFEHRQNFILRGFFYRGNKRMCSIEGEDYFD